jgi:hypothetical protein
MKPASESLFPNRLNSYQVASQSSDAGHAIVGDTVALLYEQPRQTGSYLTF